MGSWPRRRLADGTLVFSAPRSLGTEELTWANSGSLLALRYNQWKLVFPMHSVELKTLEVDHV